MLLLLQAVAQQLPPINVTVQSPPGMPEWEKTLLAAGIGALLGIFSNIAMEFVKPSISSRISRKGIERHLGDELLANLRDLEAIIIITTRMTSGDQGNLPLQLQVLEALTKTIKRDRYDHYLATQKALVYEIDSGTELSRFYELTNSLPSRVGLGSLEELQRTAEFAALTGHEYVKRHFLKYVVSPDPMNLCFPDKTPGDLSNQT